MRNAWAGSMGGRRKHESEDSKAGTYIKKVKSK